jgi:Holliday junction DNA helicase RuvA
MIGRVCGMHAAKQPPQVLVDVNGAGHEVDVPMSRFYTPPAIDEKAGLLTHMAIREDVRLLYGIRQVLRTLLRT